jgi:apoptosis-inducing factor 2
MLTRGFENSVSMKRHILTLSASVHSVGAPLAHVTKAYTNHMWKRYTHLNELQHPDLSFLHGSVTNLNPETCTAKYVPAGQLKEEQLEYDYVILATGLKRHWPAVPKSGYYADYMREAYDFIDSITGNGIGTERNVVVIGAGTSIRSIDLAWELTCGTGAVGIEFAAEIKHNHPSLKVTLIHSRSEVLSSEPLPSEAKQRAKTLLEEEGVEVILGNRASVSKVSNGQFKVLLVNGTEIQADFVLDTTKKGSATTNCLPSDCLDEQGEVKVTPQLTFPTAVPNSHRHFAAGDVVSWSGIKRAGGAMVMVQVAATNIFATLLNEEDTEAKFKLGALGEYPVVMGLAVGKQCMTYNGTDIMYGEQLMKDYFQDDLGWSGKSHTVIPLVRGRCRD